MGLYKNTENGLLPIAGKGKAEYGASTIRKGFASIPQGTAGTSNVVSVTFDTPMPDADYLVVLESNTSVIDARIVSYDKTASGFKIGYDLLAATSEAKKVYYTAYKLYTDTEYNELLDSTNWKYIACTKTEVGASAVQAALAKTPPTDLKEFYIEFEIAGGKLYTFFAPKGGSAELINALNNPQYHCYAYGSIMPNNTLQCTMTSKGTGYSSYPFYVTGMYYR